MKKFKKRPLSEDYNMSKITIENAMSDTECTGLMPTPPQSTDERESYGELINFLPEDVIELPQDF